ncbi:MAG: rod shape-determining protein MreC [Verrucomicrobiota bacterium]
MMGPFVRAGSALEKDIGNSIKDLREPGLLEEENEKLRERLAELEVVHSEREALQRENDRLRSALGFAERSVSNLLAAKILKRESSTWWSTLILDKGSEDGVELNAPVVSQEGLVGKVTAVSESVCVVLTLADERCQVGVRIEGQADRGILSGARGALSANPELRLKFLPKAIEIPVGARLYTSGDGQVFPSGILVGQVERLERGELTDEAIALPAVDFANLEILFILTTAV